MADKGTVKMIQAYFKDAGVTRFLSGFFTARPENFYNSEEIEIDVVRGEEDVAVAITDMKAGYRYNTDDEYVNKKFKPPAYKEAHKLDVFDLIKRQPGDNPYKDPRFQATAIRKAFRMFRKLENKIRRAIEIQASQIFTTGTLTLKDENGATVYTLDFKPKATHFPTAGTAWTGAADIAEDIRSLCDVIKSDGLVDPDTVIFAQKDFEVAMKNSDFKARFETRRADLGTIAPMEARGGEGGLYRGTIDVGNYKLDVWTYNGNYVDPETGSTLPYVPTGKCIIKASGARLDMTWGAIPKILPPDSRLLPYLPPRMASTRARMDLHTNIWATPDGENLMGGVGARPLLIPTDIDSFGCISTGVV
jgi:hypothetical protein